MDCIVGRPGPETDQQLLIVPPDVQCKSTNVVNFRSSQSFLHTLDHSQLDLIMSNLQQQSAVNHCCDYSHIGACYSYWTLLTTTTSNTL